MLVTGRLNLREWRDQDRAPFAAVNSDLDVMQYLGDPLTREQSDSLVDRILDHWKRHGFGLYAAELRGSGAFIGYIGLAVPRLEAHFMPAVEIGWRLARTHWGKGLATEGARAVAQHAFTALGLTALVSFTCEQNVASRRVMEKIGMTHDVAGDFDHPLLAPGHPLRRHVLYRLSAAQAGLA